MKEMGIDELKNFLETTFTLEENNDLKNFCLILKEFLNENERMPSIPNDLEYFLKRSKLNVDILAYLTENCTRFVLLESVMDENTLDLESIQNNCDLLNQFKFAAILTAEIQKIVTRKHIPSVKTIKIQ